MTHVTLLSKWYERHARKLPWRSIRDPYRIWISEVMLQQTQVATVIPYYHRFLERFPTVEALARAPEAEVLAAWSGLGYYSRARNLHRGARYIVEKLGGKFPETREAIVEVPGIGPYTAGAILSIAFDLPEALVDGNVQRVFARFFGVRETIESTSAKTFFWQKAAEWVQSAKAPRVLNQALMELGATTCVKGTPRCDQCPLQSACVAFAKGWQNELPLRKERRKNVELWWVGVMLESKGKLFLRKNPKGEWWADLWDFPHVEVPGRRQLHVKAQELARGLSADETELDHQKHTVTHHKIHVAPFLYRVKKPSSAPWPGEWFDREEIEKLPLSSLARKMLHSCSGLC